MDPGFPLDGSLFGDDQPCFGCSPHHPIGFKLRFEREGEGVVTRFQPGDQHQGPPGVMHGGLVSTIADETAAWALIARTGHFGFTTSFQCRLVRPVRVGTELEARAWLTSESSRVARIAVRISQEGADCYTGDFTFVILDEKGTEKLIGRALPERWRRFAR
jgi:acyl-coenzyme A thioesterase PaaI-like protein